MPAVLCRRQISWVAATIVLAISSFLIFRAVGIGRASSQAASSGQAQQAPASAFVPLAEYAERAPHVDSQLLGLGIQGVVRKGPSAPAPDQLPIPASQFARPVAEYITYSKGELALLEADASALQSALASGDRQAAERAWRIAFARYLQLGGVYLEGPVAALNQEIDGNPGGLQGGTANANFSGLHRIEFGLWTGAPLRSLVPWAQLLGADVRALRGTLPHVTISPLDYATRAHEILEDAVRDLLSGTDVPWSGEGVLGTAAGLSATREIISTLRPLLREPAAMLADPPPNPRSPAVVDADLNHLQSVLNSLAATHGGQLPTNQELTQMQTEALDAAIGQALEGLAQIPGMLETKLPTTVAPIPASVVRIDK